uniref:Putative ovule protein n=1 Tax=Solanum chacoense TaxID=4108 RepID=A0A0V0GGN2_SOLCH
METEIVQNAVCSPLSPNQTAPRMMSTLATGARTCITKTDAERSMSPKQQVPSRHHRPTEQDKQK